MIDRNWIRENLVALNVALVRRGKPPIADTVLKMLEIEQRRCETSGKIRALEVKRDDISGGLRRIGGIPQFGFNDDDASSEQDPKSPARVRTLENRGGNN